MSYIIRNEIFLANLIEEYKDATITDMEEDFDPFSGKLNKLKKLIVNSDSLFSLEIEAKDNAIQQMVI